VASGIAYGVVGIDHAGWPGGHCLRVPEEQEVHFHDPGAHPKALLINPFPRQIPLLSLRDPDAVASGPPDLGFNAQRSCGCAGIGRNRISIV